MGFDDSDLEFGRVQMNRRVRRALITLRANWPRVRRLLVLFAAATLLLAVRLASRNVDRVFAKVESMGEAITLEEPTYRPFRVARALAAEAAATEAYPLKRSEVNRRMQTANLRAAEEDAAPILRSGEHICLHARDLGVPFDIIFLRTEEGARAVVNPQVAENPSAFRHHKIQDARGQDSWAKLPTSLSVKFVGADLRAEAEVFQWPSSACLWHNLVTA
ncbi:Hypothetical Protein FCC1311_060112 [Hondaea fermentalgiana]|uniref:Uncharacterized protein n=1 Tax=Hondaea fermentalgiana TaxID=2315210 RepID=A0A2R5GNB2_9STRA|nr:Hypothetical Protein FCC1311_060112 [Hondaea fermentalgiana]|eukprot:GBG29791.1 Hypothetical Protein FCC1311_060112 [Hondaea fermentalgiana]